MLLKWCGKHASNTFSALSTPNHWDQSKGNAWPKPSQMMQCHSMKIYAPDIRALQVCADEEAQSFSRGILAAQRFKCLIKNLGIEGARVLPTPYSLHQRSHCSHLQLHPSAVIYVSEALSCVGASLS